MTPSPLAVYLAAVEARTEAAKDDHNIPPLVNAAAEMSMLAHARTDLPRLVRLLRVAAEALAQYADPMMYDDARGTSVSAMDMDDGSLAREALATLDRLATKEEGR